MMITPTDEASLAAGLASVAATLTSHGERFGRVEGKLDTVIERIDVVYPKLATLEQQVTNQERDISDLQAELKEQRTNQRKLFIGLVAGVIGVFVNAVLAGYVHFGG